MVEAAVSSKMCIPVYQIMQCDIPAHINRNFYMFIYIHILFRILPSFMHPLTKQ